MPFLRYPSQVSMGGPKQRLYYIYFPEWSKKFASADERYDFTAKVLLFGKRSQ